MIAEYIFYHGALLHELTLNHGGAVTIEPRDNHGRPNTFILNSKVGVYIKHSTKRLSPWTYTFTKEHLSEVQALCEYVSSVSSAPPNQIKRGSDSSAARTKCIGYLAQTGNFPTNSRAAWTRLQIHFKPIFLMVKASAKPQ